MPVISDLRRYEDVDASTAMFKGICVPRNWEMPENIWAVVQRVDRMRGAVISLYDHALSLLRAASDFVKLINRRDDYLFCLNETRDTASPYPTPRASINDVLCLAIRTGAVTKWNADYYAAGQQLERAIVVFANVVTEAEFLRLAYQWCPQGSLNREDLETWYESKVQALSLEPPKRTKFNFTLRDILVEVKSRRSGTKIFADVLASADLTRKHGLSIRKQEVFELGHSNIDIPKCRLAWISDKLLEEIEKEDLGTGPVL